MGLVGGKFDATVKVQGIRGSNGYYEEVGHGHAVGHQLCIQMVDTRQSCGTQNHLPCKSLETFAQGVESMSGMLAELFLG